MVKFQFRALFHLLRRILTCFILLNIDLRPRQTCHSKDGGSAYSIGVGELGWQYGTGLKSHGTVRVMHRKRVTCELHDSYFRMMTSKHTIPKTAEVTHSDDQLWWDIQLALGLLTRWRQEVSEFLRRDPLVTRCGRESQYPAVWGPWPPVEQPWRTRKTQREWP